MSSCESRVEPRYGSISGTLRPRFMHRSIECNTPHLLRLVSAALIVLVLIAAGVAIRTPAPKAGADFVRSTQASSGAELAYISADGCKDDVSIRPRGRCPCSGRSSHPCGASFALPSGALEQALLGDSLLDPLPYVAGRRGGAAHRLFRPPEA